jgi:hypothetical protein
MNMEGQIPTMKQREEAANSGVLAPTCYNDLIINTMNVCLQF